MDKESCKKCVWCDKVDKEILFCIFPSCIRKEEKKDDEASGNI